MSGLAPSGLGTTALAKRQARLRQELIVRAGVAMVMLVFNELFTINHASAAVIRLTALLGLALVAHGMVSQRSV